MKYSLLGTTTVLALLIACCAKAGTAAPAPGPTPAPAAQPPSSAPAPILSQKVVNALVRYGYLTRQLETLQLQIKDIQNEMKQIQSALIKISTPATNDQASTATTAVQKEIPK